MSNSDKELGFQYWARWQVPVCALFVVLPAVLALHFIRKARAPQLFLCDLCGSRWRNFNPLWLLIYRAFAFVCLALLLFRVVTLLGAFAFYFYTQWTFALVVVYFVLATVVSAYGQSLNCKRESSENEEEVKFVERDLGKSTISSFNIGGKDIECACKLPGHLCRGHLPQGARILGNLMQMTHLTCAAAVVLTDIVFWCIIVPFLTDENFHLDLLMGCMHSLNAVFLLGDTALNNLPFPWLGFSYFVIWSCIYIAFQWIMHACGFTWWPYPFLELNTPWAPVWYIGLAVFHVPCYGLYAAIVQAKNSLLPRLFQHAFVR